MQIIILPVFCYSVKEKKNKFVFDLFLQPQFCEFKDEDIVVEKKTRNDCKMAIY